MQRLSKSMKILYVIIWTICVVGIRHSDAFCGDIRSNPKAAEIVGECQGKHMPAQFMDPLMECVNARFGREVSLAQFFAYLCEAKADFSYGDKTAVENCIAQQWDYVRENREKLIEGSNEADVCIINRLNSETNPEESNRKRRSPFADAFTIKKRRSTTLKNIPSSDSVQQTNYPTRNVAPRTYYPSGNSAPQTYYSSSGNAAPRTYYPARNAGHRTYYPSRNPPPQTYYPARNDAPRTYYPARNEGPQTYYQPRNPAPQTYYPARNAGPRTYYPSRNQAPQTYYPPRNAGPRTYYPARNPAPQTYYPARNGGQRAYYPQRQVVAPRTRYPSINETVPSANGANRPSRGATSDFPRETSLI